MDNFNSHYTHKAHSLSAVHFRTSYNPKSTTESAKTQAASAPRDEVTFSEEAKLLSEANLNASSTNSAAPRLGLVNRVRSEIAAGTYDTPEKLDIALERMLGIF